MLDTYYVWTLWYGLKDGSLKECHMLWNANPSKIRHFAFDMTMLRLQRSSIIRGDRWLNAAKSHRYDRTSTDLR